MMKLDAGRGPRFRSIGLGERTRCHRKFEPDRKVHDLNMTNLTYGKNPKK